tara:strand:- start:2033 stop:2404 length:372 start_codon:yes stop_codon:yes gene_type:complete
MADYSSQSKFLGDFVKDELDCASLGIEDFGAPIDNENNDVPLYDQYNRGLAACETGMDRRNLTLEGGKRDKSQRMGLTGYIPAIEQAGQYPGSSPKSPKLLIGLGKPSEEMYKQSLMRRGLTA